MPEETANTADLFEIIRTTRSMRRLKPDPVPNELIRKVVEAGVCAPCCSRVGRMRIGGPALSGSVATQRAWTIARATAFNDPLDGAHFPRLGRWRERFGEPFLASPGVAHKK